MRTIYTNDLILEVTRRCNMACEHCLRGDAQNLDMSDSIIRWAAKNIEACSVTFTGGEPSLNIRAIELYFTLAEQYGNLPRAFYVATNGKANQEKLAVTLLKAYAKMAEPEACELNWSMDAFHNLFIENDELKGAGIFEGLSFYRKDGKKHDVNDTDMRWLLVSGRAAENGIGEQRVESAEPNLEDWNIEENDGVFWFDELYVAANGNIAKCCDLEYGEIDEGSPCKIQELPAALRKMQSQAEKAGCIA